MGQASVRICPLVFSELWFYPSSLAVVYKMPWIASSKENCVPHWRQHRRALPTFLLALAALGGGSCSPADQPTGKVGEPIQAGDYELTVTNLDAHASSPDRFTNPKPGNVLVKA